MTKKDEVVITVRLDRALAKSFGDIAKANNRNKSVLIRDWVYEYIKKHRQTKLGI
ncbi:ribbon-helix-helix domain-containing protein [Moraxella catarrhalis]|uniref:ribbon-helix-helix domain-containing protein n=1 Tax=Moraxella catarrhalis TaxID=480 RepID=UPI0013D19C02|nr:ribbon-helix-helix domain-containing protein [Moraxella catarrhalis]